MGIGGLGELPGAADNGTTSLSAAAGVSGGRQVEGGGISEGQGGGSGSATEARTSWIASESEQVGCDRGAHGAVF